MTDENFGFCPHCGAKLSGEAVYCPECGGLINSSAAQNSPYGAPGYNPYMANPNLKGKARPMEGTFMWVFILLLMYSILMLSSGLSTTFYSEGTVNMINAMIEQYGMTFEEFFETYMGVALTEAELISLMKTSGILALMSAIPATVSTVLCFTRRKHMIAVVMAGIATGVVLVEGIVVHDMLGMILDVLIGAGVTYMLYKSCADYFED